MQLLNVRNDPMERMILHTEGRLKYWFPPAINRHPSKLAVDARELAAIVAAIEPHCSGAIRHISPLSRTDRSTLYRVTTADNKTSVAKISEMWTQHLPIAHEYRMLGIAAAVPVPLPIPRPLVYHEDEHLAWLLREHVPGDQLASLIGQDAATEAQKLQWLACAGHTLATLHNAGISEASAEQCLAYGLERARHNLTLALYDPEEFCDTDAPAQVYQWLCTHQPDHLRTSLLHGDFRPKNIFVQDHERYVAIIDWEHSMLGDPYYDLAIFAYYCRTQEELDSFFNGYGLQSIDATKLHYFDILSKFLNI